MKLRALALLILLSANLAFFAWTQGWLDAVIGVRAAGDREPERLARQFQPQVIRILAQRGALPASAAAPRASCLEAGPYTQAEAAAAEGLLRAAALPAGAWTRRNIERPGAWIVYLGRFASPEVLQKKTDELRRLQASFEEVQSPAELAPGLSLGRFDDRAAAEAALAQATLRGVRSARVVTVSEPSTVTALRVERADAALAAQLAAIGGEVRGEPLGKAFAPCAP